MQWFNSVSNSLGSFSIASLFQRISSYWQEPKDEFFMQAMEDECYQVYCQWCSEVRQAERSLRRQLDRKQLSPDILQKALMLPLTNLSSSLISPLYYYLRLAKLAITIQEKGYPNAIKESVQKVGNRLKDLLKENPELTRNYFCQDIINHLIELSAQRFTANKLLNWIKFYEGLVEESLYQSVSQVLNAFVKAHNADRITARHYKTLIVQLNKLFQATNEEENSAEVSLSEKSSHLNYRYLALAGLALTGSYAAHQAVSTSNIEQGLTQASWQGLKIVSMSLSAWSMLNQGRFSYSQSYSQSFPVFAGSLSTLFTLTTGQVTTGVFTTGEITTGEVTTGEVTTGEVTTGTTSTTGTTGTTGTTSTTTSTNEPTGLSTNEEIGIAVAAVVAGLGLFGGVAYKFYQRRKNPPVDLEKNGSHLSSKERRAIDRFILINDLDARESKTLYEQSGILVEVPEGALHQKVVLGEGEFGKVKLAYDLEAHEFVAVKKIKGVEAMEASEQERLIHKRLNGLSHILPLLHSKITEDSQRKPAFYQFSRLAGFGNGEILCQQLAQVTDKELKWKLIQHVGQGLLTGIASMHAKNTYHLDIKPQNYMLTINGMVYVIDFGCAREFASTVPCWIEDGSTGDASCFSPERLANFRYCFLKKEQNVHPATEVIERYDAEKADAWSAGLAMLGLILGRYPLSDNNLNFNERLNHWDSAYMSQLLETAFVEVENKDLLASQRGRSLFEIIKGLLTIDPAKRLTAREAIKHPLFEEKLFKAEELREQFRTLKEFGITIKIENSNVETRRDISLYNATVTSRSENPYYGSVPSLALKS